MSETLLGGLENAFFEAMAAGWVQDARETSILELPGMKALPFHIGDYRVLDMYAVSPVTGNSSGSTTIWHRDIPIWVMYYGGHYSKIAMPFLKSCLRRAYVEERCFYGGRGPYFVRDDRFVYINDVVSNYMMGFEGEERVFDLNECLLGSHWYRGMSLL